MKAKFEDTGRKDCIIITAEGDIEAAELQRWDNCIVSSKFDYDYRGSPSHPTLTLMKEI